MKSILLYGCHLNHFVLMGRMKNFLCQEAKLNKLLWINVDLKSVSRL